MDSWQSPHGLLGAHPPTVKPTAHTVCPLTDCFYLLPPRTRRRIGARPADEVQRDRCYASTNLQPTGPAPRRAAPSELTVGADGHAKRRVHLGTERWNFNTVCTISIRLPLPVDVPFTRTRSKACN